MGGIVSNHIHVKVWHKFSDPIPHGWPQGGCLFFTINEGTTIQKFIDQMNEHRRPEYHIRNLYKQDGSVYNGTDVIQTTDLYL